MKSTVIFKEEKSKNYPILMATNKGVIVLFTSYETGVCVKEGNSPETLGEYSDNWDMDKFLPFSGEVTLSN